MSILKTLELFKLAPARMAIVVDDCGTLQGVVTQTDFLEAIAGDLPDTSGPLGHDESGVVQR
jgi:putative hemolysin